MIVVQGLFIAAGSRIVDLKAGGKRTIYEVSLLFEGASSPKPLECEPELLPQLSKLQLGQPVSFKGALGQYDRLMLAGLHQVQTQKAA